MQLCGRPRQTWNREEEEQDEYALGSASICAVEADLQGKRITLTVEPPLSHYLNFKGFKS